MDEQRDPSGTGPDPGGPGRPERPRVRPVDLRDYVRFEPGEATRVRVLQTDRVAMDLWCVEPRLASPVLHLADRDVTYTVIAGRSWFATDDGEVGLDPMGAMLVPADVVHAFENRSPDPLIVLAVSSPPGEGDEAPPAEPAAEAVTLPSGRPGPVRRALATLLGTGGPRNAPGTRGEPHPRDATDGRDPGPRS